MSDLRAGFEREKCLLWVFALILRFLLLPEFFSSTVKGSDEVACLLATHLTLTPLSPHLAEGTVC